MDMGIAKRLCKKIDFIIARDKALFLDVGHVSKFNFDSDHRAVRAQIRLNEKFERAKQMKKFAVPGEKLPAEAVYFRTRTAKSIFSLLGRIT